VLRSWGAIGAPRQRRRNTAVRSASIVLPDDVNFHHAAVEELKVKAGGRFSAPVSYLNEALITP